MALKRERKELSVEQIDESLNNPNVMEPEKYAALVEAIKRFGFLQPMLVRPNPDAAGRYIACDGNHRLRAAKDAGLTTIPVEAIAPTREEADALQVSMNRLRGDLNLAATADIVVGLQTAGWGAADLAVLGFSEEELADLVASTESDPDIMPEAIAAPDDGAAAGAQPILEVPFDSMDDLKRARRALKKAAGKGGSLAQGLLNLLDAE